MSHFHPYAKKEAHGGNSMKIKYLSLFILLSFNLNAKVYQVGNLEADMSLSTSAGYDSSEEGISIYNTGIELELKHMDHPQASVYFRGNINGKIDEINGDNFKLDEFVSELKANYEFDRENAVILLSVGKMVTGTKVNQSDPSKLKGVMGFRLSVKPKKIPLIQEWMKRNGLKITRIDITRYDSGSQDDLDFSNLADTDMTAYALYLSKGRNLHTFFILKQPDADSHAPRGISIGAAYMRYDLPLKPQFFGLYHNSKSDYVDVDVYVLSASFEVIEETRFAITWSRAIEHIYDVDEQYYDYSLSRRLYQGGSKRNPGTVIDGSVGVRSEDPNVFEGNNDYYLRIEIKN